MTGNINELSRYSQVDIEKSNLIKKVLYEYGFDFAEKYERLLSSEIKLCAPSLDLSDSEYEFDELNESSIDNSSEDSSKVFYSRGKKRDLLKYCPKCGRKYPLEENVCFDCLVHLKNISDRIDVCDIESDPKFDFTGKNSYESFEDILSKDNLFRINDFQFTIDDYSDILHEIKSQAFKNFDNLVNENKIDFDELDILEKIILFAKSFVKIDYKSHGGQLGYFESGTIFIDDRQTISLQITTMIHELSHFLIQEILIHIFCRLLDATRNSFIEALITFILSYSHFTQLIDEYAAHNVEGRFTIFGFQDYSSFTQIERRMDGEMTGEEIEITKSIGNTFAISIKGILESLIDRQLREDIKNQFLKDVLDRPNYAALEMENCQILNDEGFIKAIWLMLNEGCEVASLNIDKLMSIKSQ